MRVAFPAGKSVGSPQTTVVAPDGARGAEQRPGWSDGLELSIKVPHGPDRTNVLGAGDRNLKLIREALGVRMVTRDGTIRLMGDRANVLAARDVLRALNEAAQGGGVLNRQQVHDLIGTALATAEGKTERPDVGEDEEMLTGPAWTDHLSVYAAGRPIKAKTVNQQAYLDAIRDHDVVFGVGPAGTGKTFLCLNIVKQAQKLGYDVIYCDSEGALDDEQVKTKFKIDPLKMRYQPIKTVFQFKSFVSNLLQLVAKAKAETGVPPKIP